MLAGSYALVGWGDNFAVGGHGRLSEATSTASPVPSTVVTDITNTAQLDPGVMVVSVPLGVNFSVPGSLYGTKAKAPLHLGPENAKGMTKDGFGPQAALPLPDGQRILYHFWKELTPFPSYAPGDPEVAGGTHMSTPSIRLIDTTSGEDSVVVDGARSMAWRADGMFAYAKGVDPDYRLNVPYLQRLFVQEGLNGSPQVWTSDADVYQVLQWVKDSLFVWREPFAGDPELLAFTGPDQVRRVLTEGQFLLAVSPDGERVLATSGGGDPTQSPFVIHLVDWETGIEKDRLSFDGLIDSASGSPLSGMHCAAWAGERIVVGVHPAHVAILSVKDDALSLERVLTFRYPRIRPGSVDELLLDESGSTLYVVASEGSSPDSLERTSVLTYDIDSGQCTRWIVPGPPAISRLVSNPSRPSGR